MERSSNAGAIKIVVSPLESKTKVLEKRVETAQAEAVRHMLSLQHAEGYWVFDLEADSTITSEYVMLQRFLGREIPEELKNKFRKYLFDKQMDDGGWPLYTGGFADVSASVKAYLALKILGEEPNEPHMVKARHCIRNLGGASKVNVFTRIALALFGQLSWKTAPAMPIQIMLLPKWFFFHLSKVSYWSRTVIVPLLILYALRPVCKLSEEEGVRELFTEGEPEKIKNIDRFKLNGFLDNAFILLDRCLKLGDPVLRRVGFKQGLDRALSWTIKRMQGEGGVGAIFPAMANAVMALHVLGYSNDHPDMARGIKALDDLVLCDEKCGNDFCQPCVSPIWDTCLALSAVMESDDLSGDKDLRDALDKSAEKAVDWLFSKQIYTDGDWSTHNKTLEPAGWAFQFENALYPDLDDTPMVLMALMRAGVLEKEKLREKYQEKFQKGVRWTVGLQSSDGGWGSFDKDNNKLYLNKIPFADHGALLDPPTSDLTGRCMELLSMCGHDSSYEPLQRAHEFLCSEQEEDGSWYGRWGVNYIYGTWSVIMGLRQYGHDLKGPRIHKAVKWLKDKQNADGGWGESCYSYFDPATAGEGVSMPSQTAWALLALLAAGEHESEAVKDGITYLLDTQRAGGDWVDPYFNGTGFPRVFYLHYHGYSRYFPLWALNVYKRVSAGKPTRQDEVRLSDPLPL
jgi:squalene-hopene/tetraprenyl-beta-curcumene cyclase